LRAVNEALRLKGTDLLFHPQEGVGMRSIRLAITPTSHGNT